MIASMLDNRALVPERLGNSVSRLLNAGRNFVEKPRGQHGDTAPAESGTGACATGSRAAGVEVQRWLPGLL
ncbi:MAG: hypothetical protein E6471_18155, partial [Bradyrhizobium sp.]|nr:hypothetical protein [Bradyrhizobium sp.]